ACAAGWQGILLRVQRGINRLGEFFAYARRLGDLLGAGTPQLLQSSEVFEQLAATGRSDPGDPLQGGGAPRLAAPGAMPGDGEPVGFVANLLDQVQRRRVGRQRELMLDIVKVQGFQDRKSGVSGKR